MRVCHAILSHHAGNIGMKRGHDVSQSEPTGFSKSLRDVRAGRLTWLWLLVGFVLLPFTIVQTMIPLAAWLAPIFLLRFARTARRASVALTMIFLAEAIGNWIALRGGGDVGNIYMAVFGLILFSPFRGLVSTLPYAADRLLGSRLDEKTRALVFPLAYVTVDWLMTLLPVVNSTASFVYSQYDSLALMQIVSITGMWGITFLIGWGASTVNALWERGFDCRPVRGVVIPFVAVLIAVVLFGSIRLNFAAPSSPTVMAATVTIDHAVYQRAISPPFNWATFYRSTDDERGAVRPQLKATVDQMLERSESALRAGAKIVGWQEASAQVLEEDRQQTLDRASDLARRYDAYMQVEVSVFTRASTHHYYRNQSILIDNTGQILATYEKTYPVIPGEAYVSIPGPGKLPVANTPYGRMGTAICNDFHFPALARQAGRNDVDIMMAPYNDSIPFGQQDAVVAIFRAIENGYSMVKATGNGPSMITDYQGRILGRQNYGDGGGVMLATVPTHGVVTIYSRIGDLFAYFCVAGSIFLAIWAFVRKHPEVAPIQ
ncbi:MAG: nitrilase-related carbon-nitrogen hydrolase [Candidatus Binatus sp.]